MLKFTKRKSMVSEDPIPPTNSQLLVENTEDGEGQTKRQFTDNGTCETSNNTSFENGVDENLPVEVDTRPMTVSLTENVDENPADDGLISSRGNSQKSGENVDTNEVCEPEKVPEPQRTNIFEPQSNCPQSTRVDQESLMSRIKYLQTKQADTENDLQVTAVLSSSDNFPSPMLSNTESENAEGNSSGYVKSWRLLVVDCRSALETSWFAFKTYLQSCRSLKSLIEGALCYVICFILCLLCLVLGLSIEEHKDVPFCVMSVTLWCCFVTLSFERGFFTRWLDKQAMMTSSFNEDIDDYSTSSLSWCLCCNQEVRVENRSQYTRSRKETSTAFICEVSDVANINVDDCPQVKEVEPEGVENTSFDHCSERPTKTVRAVVHRSESDAERPTPGCQLGCEGACACPNLNAKPELTSSEVPACPLCGHSVPCACRRRRRKVTEC